jgi:hypothetical protein
MDCEAIPILASDDTSHQMGRIKNNIALNLVNMSHLDRDRLTSQTREEIKD